MFTLVSKCPAAQSRVLITRSPGSVGGGVVKFLFVSEAAQLFFFFFTKLKQSENTVTSVSGILIAVVIVIDSFIPLFSLSSAVGASCSGAGGSGPPSSRGR